MTPRVVLTTAPGSFDGVESLLADLPATLRRHPLQEYHPLPVPALDAALDTPARWDGVVLTSPRAASILAARLRTRSPVPRLRAFVTGEATARPLAASGIALLLADEGPAALGAAERLATRIVGEAVRGPLLYLAGDPHRPDLVARLSDAGIGVETMVVYRSAVVGDVELMAVLTRADIVVLGSPMVVDAIAAQGEDVLGAGFVAIGPTTAEACRERGLPLLAVADHPSVAGVAAAIRQAITRF